MKIVFLGTPEFAVISLDKLIKSGKHEILAVVTQPDRPAGRGNKLTQSPVKEYALKNGLKVYDYIKVSRDGVDDLKELKPDIMITAAYGQILSQEIIDIPRFGIINVHASILPKYRGASPIQSAIIEGEEVTGVTIMQTEAGLDTGDILSCIKTYIGEYESAGDLTLRLADIGADLLIDTLDEIAAGNIKPEKQNQVEATITRKIGREDCVLNFYKSAKQVKNLIYGANPDPVASAIMEGSETVLRVYECRIVSDLEETKKGLPGEIIEPTSAKKGVFVQCNPGVIELLKVQLPGKNIMDAKVLVSGRKLNIGDKFIFKVSTVK